MFYNAQAIEKQLNTKYIGRQIAYFDEITSTNDYAKEWAKEGAREGTLVVAETQMNGRGRLGRNWHSPKGTGIWMSLVLRPQLEIHQIPQLTLIAGLSMCEAIRGATGLEAGIKWPNDIVVEGKKVCGILAEAGLQGGTLNYVVVGVGVNVNTEVFSEDLPYASSLRLLGDKEYDRVHVLVAFAKYFEEYYEAWRQEGNLTPILKRYKIFCLNLNKQAIITNNEAEEIVYVSDVTQDGNLLIQDIKGNLRCVASGEISIRGLYGYI